MAYSPWRLCDHWCSRAADFPCALQSRAQDRPALCVDAAAAAPDLSSPGACPVTAGRYNSLPSITLWLTVHSGVQRHCWWCYTRHWWRPHWANVRTWRPLLRALQRWALPVWPHLWLEGPLTLSRRVASASKSGRSKASFHVGGDAVERRGSWCARGNERTNSLFTPVWQGPHCAQYMSHAPEGVRQAAA